MLSVNPGAWGYGTHDKKIELFVSPTYVEMSFIINNNAV